MSLPIYTACPNNAEPGRAHEFEAYTPFDGADPHFIRVIFCRQCGEVRPLELPPIERTADERGVARITKMRVSKTRKSDSET